MGNSNSRIDKFYGNYEKSFERIEKNVERLRARGSARAKRKAMLSFWTTAGLVLALGIAVAIIYQVQRQPPGTYTYQEHFHRVGGAMAMPAVAFGLHWVALLVLGLVDARDAKKLKALEAAKRNMIKELKDMSRFDKIKSLVDKFDPDATTLLSPAPMMSPGSFNAQGTPYQLQQQRRGQQQQGQVPAMIVRGSGQVAGAAAMAVAGAGKAIMPIFDRLANTLMSDNPLLLADLRNTEMRVAGAEYESCLVKCDNVCLKQRVLELELKADLMPSYDPDALQQELRQLQNQQLAAQQQLQRIMQQCNAAAAAATGGACMGPLAMGPGPGSITGSEAGGQLQLQQQQGLQGDAVPAHELVAGAGGVLSPGSGTPSKVEGLAQEEHEAAAAAAGGKVDSDGMGEGLMGASTEQVVQEGSVRQRKRGKK